MNFKLTNTDNPLSVGHSFIGKILPFSYDGEVFYFGSLRSSKVQSIIKEDGKLVVETKNTKYTFEKEQ